MEGSAVDLISRPGTSVQSLGSSHLQSLKLNRELANRVGACCGLPQPASASSCVTTGDNPPEAVGLIILPLIHPSQTGFTRLLLPPTAPETKGRSRARLKQWGFQNQGTLASWRLSPGHKVLP